MNKFFSYSDKGKQCPQEQVEEWSKYWNTELHSMLIEGLAKKYEYQKENKDEIPNDKCKKSIEDFIDLAKQASDIEKQSKLYDYNTERCFRYTIQVQKGFMCNLCNVKVQFNISRFTKILSIETQECRIFSKACSGRFYYLNRIYHQLTAAQKASECNVEPDRLLKYNDVKKEIKNQINEFTVGKNEDNNTTKQIETCYETHNKKDGKTTELDFDGHKKLTQSCLHICEKFYSVDGMTKIDTKVGPLLMHIINFIHKNWEMKYAKTDVSESIKNNPFNKWQMDESNGNYQIIEKKNEITKKWTFSDYEILFVNDGMPLIKQGKMTGFKNMNELHMKYADLTTVFLTVLLGLSLISI